MNTFAEIIENIRVLKKLKSESDVAKLLGVPRQNLSSFKNRNKPPFDKLVDFCARENISIDWLLLGRGDPALGKPGDDLAVRVKKIEELLKNKLE